MIWQFFERKVCLTLGGEPWGQAQEEFARVGLTDVQPFFALPDIGPHESNNRSVRQIFLDFYASGANTLLLLEDDCVFRDLGHLEEAIHELPRDWDVFFLGANIRDESPLRLSDHIYRVNDAWTNHCKAYNRKVIPFILRHQPGFSEIMHDTWLGAQMFKINAYVVKPMVAVQRPHYSTIWKEDNGEQKFVDYSDVWELSEGRMR